MNSSPESPKHRIEFTGNSATKKRRKPRKPPPAWLVGWFGYLLLFVVGAALGGFAAVGLLWKLLEASDDEVSMFGVIFAMLWAAIIGAVVGGIVGLLLWGWLCIRASEWEERD